LGSKFRHCRPLIKSIWDDSNCCLPIDALGWHFQAAAFHHFSPFFSSKLKQERAMRDAFSQIFQSNVSEFRWQKLKLTVSCQKYLI